MLSGMGAPTPMLDVVESVLVEDGWPVHRMADGAVISTSVATDSHEWSCFACAFEADQQFAFYSVYPTKIDESVRPAMAELITRANYGLVLGNFEMDFGDGELRFKTSIDTENDRLSPALARTLIYANISVTGHYIPAIDALGSGGTTPAEALARTGD